jgi:hypothetical protein
VQRLLCQVLSHGQLLHRGLDLPFVLQRMHCWLL